MASKNPPQPHQPLAHQLQPSAAQVARPPSRTAARQPDLKPPLLAQTQALPPDSQRAPAPPQAGGPHVEPIRILFLNTRDALGADVAVHITLARAFDATPVQVWAATGLHETGPDSARTAFTAIQGLTVLPLDLGRPISDERGIGRLAATLANLRGAANLVTLAIRCRRGNIDIIHVTDRPRDSLFGLILARLAGCACLIHAHTNYVPENFTNMNQWVFRHADAIVGVSNFTAATYRDAAGRKTPRIYGLPNAVDTTLFGQYVTPAQRLAMRQRLDVPGGVPLIACVARLMRWKDQATLLKAVGQLTDVFPQVRLVLAGADKDISPDGNGSYQDYLSRLARTLNIEKQVRFTGYLSRSEMPLFYAAADIVAHPAIGEPFGLAVVEGLFCARPVVAVAAGGIPEIIRDGVDGLLVSPGQPAALAAALRRVLSDPALAARLAAAGRERVLAHFTPAVQAAGMLEIYRCVVGPKHRRSVSSRHSGGIS